MLHNYQEAIAYLEGKKESGIRFDLTRIELLMDELRHPERRVKTIHVTGTNGKGSTVTFLRSILEETGLFVGTFMTPVYGSIEQQISINNQSMSEEDFTSTLSEIMPAIEKVEKELNELISEFEVMTALALYYFSTKKPVDIAIIETGMGGRKDATNVITPLLSIITNVALDHQDFLGDTVEEIAKEKAGIIKPGVPVVTASNAEALNIIRNEAKEKNSSLYPLTEKCTFTTYSDSGNQYLSYEAPYRKLERLHLGMLGDHQSENAAIAILALDYLKQFYAVMVDDEHIKNGLTKAKLPGRFELVYQNPTIILDTAHNVAAIKKTTALTKQLYPNKKVSVLFAAMKDKDIEGMLAVLTELSNDISITTFDYPRAATLSSLKTIQKQDHLQLVKHPQQWLAERKKQGSDDDLLLITGSNYFVEKVREYLT